MPSSRTRVGFLVVFGALAGCDSQRDVISALCKTLEECTNVERPNCGTRLADDVNDRRISSASIAVCQDCLERNTKRNTGDCAPVLAGRECDKACADLPIVLDAYTNRVERKNLCDDVLGRCTNRCSLYDGTSKRGEGGESGEGGAPSANPAGSSGSGGTAGAGTAGTGGVPEPRPGSCEAELEDVVLKRPAIDREIAHCLACVRESVGDRSTLAPGTNDAVCGSMISRCTEVCTVVPDVSEELANTNRCFALENAAVQGYCVEMVRCDAAFETCVDETKGLPASTPPGGDPVARLSGCTGCLMALTCEERMDANDLCEDVCEGLPERPR